MFELSSRCYIKIFKLSLRFYLNVTLQNVTGDPLVPRRVLRVEQKIDLKNKLKNEEKKRKKSKHEKEFV